MRYETWYTILIMFTILIGCGVIFGIMWAGTLVHLPLKKLFIGFTSTGAVLAGIFGLITDKNIY